MKSIHQQLETLRSHKQDEAAWELAEEHFSKSRIILRNALYRFKNSIQYKIRLRVIFTVLQKIYHNYLHNMYVMLCFIMFCLNFKELNHNLFYY